MITNKFAEHDGPKQYNDETRDRSVYHTAGNCHAEELDIDNGFSCDRSVFNTAGNCHTHADANGET